MRQLDSKRLPRTRLAPALAAIPFFARLQREAPQQLGFLLDNARLLALAPGEVVIREGDFDAWFFFVLRGRLQVSRGGGAQAPLAILVPGEVFGALAVIRDSERNATIAATGEGEAILLGLDAAPFGELDELGVIALVTKLAFLETVNERLRLRLQAYRLHFPERAAAKHLIPESESVTTDLEGLRELAEQTDQLGELLAAWNEQLSPEEHGMLPAAGELPDLVPDWQTLTGS